MTVIKAGVGVDYGNGHVYPGDGLQCKKCGHKVILAIVGSINDPDYTLGNGYLKMKGVRGE